ncbi:MAG: Bug family tripartite tricarboxylate transporter substrate binding protein [Burkholderiaceae bacterium]
MLTRREFGAGLAAAAAALSIPKARADNWPSKSVRLIVPYAPGGTTDRLARDLSEFLRRELRQTILVENRPGASTNIGSEMVARAEPDGYTFLIGNDLLATNPETGPQPGFDPHRDLAPVSLLTRVPCLIAAGPKFAGKDIVQMIRMARAAPNKYTISSAALDLQVGHLNSGSDISLVHVPYKGGAQAAADTVGGQIDMVIANVPVLAGLVRSGRLRALAVSSEQRVEAFPDVPTLRESGLSNAAFANWYAVFAPARTPAPVIQRMAELTRRYVEEPEVRKRMANEGSQLEYSTPDQLAQLLKQDAAQAQAFVKRNPVQFKR